MKRLLAVLGNRLRVPTGLAMIAIVTLFTINLAAAELPQASTAAYSTKTVVSCAAGCTLQLSANGGVVALPANGTTKLDLTGYTTLVSGFGSWTVPDGAEAEAVIRYSDGKSVSQFTVLPLNVSLAKVGDKGEIPRVVNDVDEHAFVTILNTSASAAAVTLYVYDGVSGKLLATESTIATRGISQYALLTPLTAGRLVVQEGWTGNVGGGGTADATLYIFGVMGPPDGKTQRIEYMKAVTP